MLIISIWTENVMLKKYSRACIKEILETVKTIAIVGVSSKPDRDSYKVMKFLMKNGFKVFPVNPNEKIILKQKCYSSLSEIKEKVDMVDIFRADEFILDLAKEAIEINANIFWTQEGIYNEQAEFITKRNGLKVIMDECPKKILLS